MIAIAVAALFAVQPAQDTTYFQQGVEYRIEARLDESTDVLSGRARLRYTNRSESTLDTLWLHQHLNAFRPNSAWATRELEFGVRRFQDLGPDEHAFERFTSVTVDGTQTAPHYPLSPDSTVVGLPLRQPLRPGGSVEVMMDWDARLATLPRRQGRAGRHYDFAQWYPRVAVFDRGGWQVQPLMPQGEFYGEFGSFDVTLDLMEDQVLGSTGVPVEGDPGWAAAAAPGHADVNLARDAYPAAPAAILGLLGEPDEGRRQVRWRAEDVHHFAWSANPEFIYEGGEYEGIPVHVLYQPGDTAWDDGVAVRRTVAAMAFMDEMFGEYPWPQITNLHRIESGGTEFPMLIMDGSASEGLIVHEITHQYLHGILANNEWAEGWLDEGFTSFMTSWYFEEQGQPDVWSGALGGVAERERQGLWHPVATPGADFPDPQTYSLLTYTKPSLVLYMLREMIGEDTMRQALRTLYERKRLQHFTEADLRAAVNDAAGEDLDWFFDQWLHTTATLDYGIGDASIERTADGRYRTRVEVIRIGRAWMPVTLQVGSVMRELASRERRQVVEVVTPERPDRVVLDPQNQLLDIDPSNNVVEPGALSAWPATAPFASAAGLGAR